MNKRLIAAILLGGVLATIVVRSLSISKTRLIPVNDEVSFLELSRDFAARGGIVPTLRDYVGGRVDEDIRHPLHLFLLTALTDGTARDFTRGKLLSLAEMLALLLLVFFLGRGIWGEDVALLSAALLGLSPISAMLSQEILADVLFALFYFAALTLLTRRDDVKGWIGFGAMSGFAYLAKGNGHFLFLSALAVGMYRHRIAFFRRPHLYLSGLAFFLVASPLIVRNVELWHTLFYNRNNKIFWMDTREQYLILHATDAWNEIGPRWFLAHHSLGDIFHHFARGLSATAAVLVLSMSVGPRNFFLCFATGLVVSGFALYGARLRWRAGCRDEVLALSATSLVLFVLFSWYLAGQEAHWRYTYPLAVSWLPLAAFGILSFFKRDFFWKIGIGLGSAVLAAAAVPRLGGNPLNYQGVPNFWRQTSEWLCSHTKDGGFVIDNHSRYSTWESCRLERLPFPILSVDPAEGVKFAQANGARAILLDSTVSRDQAFENAGPSDSFGPVSFGTWPRCFHDDNRPSVFLTYAADCPEMGR